jgi:magnesium chelatase subunit I
MTDMKGPSLMVYPFAAIVDQENMKLGLILNVINPTLSGVLIRGEKGTCKSTAVRALAEILPEIEVIANCPFQRAPRENTAVCRECGMIECRNQVLAGKEPDIQLRKIRVIDLPVGATEDRVVGTMDLEHALRKGEKRIEPGILAEAHRGILYVDEVNLLDDHLVDILLDSAAMGVNTVEREGISFTHPAAFTLVGTMNPEEGELRPQLLDRFGLCVNIEGIQNAERRVEVMERRIAFDGDSKEMTGEWEEESKKYAENILKAKELLPEVSVERKILFEIAALCLDVGVDGHRGDIITLKAAKTLAAYDGRREVIPEDVERAAELVLPHRVRRQPFQEIIYDVKSYRRAAKQASGITG